jgi:hypothetical protein
VRRRKLLRTGKYAQERKEKQGRMKPKEQKMGETEKNPVKKA